MHLSSLLLFLQMVLGVGDAKGQCGVTISCTGGPVVSGKVSAQLDVDVLEAIPNSATFPVDSVKWYRNGILVNVFGFSPVPTTYPCAIDEMGIYRVYVYSNGCGRDSAEVKVSLFAKATDTTTYVSGYRFTGTTTLSKISGSAFPDYVFGGDIFIEKGCTLNVIGSTNPVRILCKPCTRIIIEKGDAVTDGGIFNANGVEFLGMDEWQGIVVEGEATVAQGPVSGVIRHGLIHNLDGLVIKDAHLGLDILNGGQAKIAGAIFQNNHIGLAVRDYTFQHQLILNNLHFIGSYINNPDSCDGVAHRYKGFYQPQLRKMIYLDGVNDVRMEADTLFGNLFSAGGNSGFVAFNSEKIKMAYNYMHGEMAHALSVSATSDLWCDTFGIDGHFAEAVKMHNTNECRIGSANPLPPTPHINYFFGDILVALKSTGCTSLRVQNCKFDIQNVIPAGIVNTVQFQNGAYPQLLTSDFKNIVGTASYFENCYKAKVQGCTYENTNVGLHLYNNQSVEVSQSAFEQPSTGLHGNGNENIDIRDCVFENFGNPGSSWGIYLEQNDTLSVTDNLIKEYDYGLQVYGHQTNNTGNISLNRFYQNKYALVLSPEENPVTAAVNANTDTTYQNISIACNLFWKNDYALLGSGNIIDQGNSTTGAGNVFDNNVEYNLLWQDNDVNWFEYYYPSGSSDQDPTVVLGGASLDLNGVSSPQDFNYPISMNPTTCAPTYPIALNRFIPEKSPSVWVSNPLADELLIGHAAGLQLPAELYLTNQLGQNFTCTLSDKGNGKSLIETRHLAPGVYYLSIAGTAFKLIKY